MPFTHLHVHTEYSLLDGSSKIKEITKRAAELGMNSLAITDHGVMYGVIDFYRAAKEAGIKPVIGCEVYVTPGSRFDREVVHGEDRYYHLILLAENDKGYANLMKIVSKGFTDGFYYRPRVDYEVLREYSEGLIALSACLAGEVPRHLARGSYEEAKKAALKHLEIFGRGNYFLELQNHGIEEQQNVNLDLVRLSQELGIELVATNDVHYTYEDDVQAHDILLCIQTGKKVSDEDRMRYEGGQFFLKSEEEMRKLFPYAGEALDNTQKIADRCNVEIEFGVTKLPEYPVPDGREAFDYLASLCESGLKNRYENTDTSLRERMKYELDVIKNMGYVDYFLIVWDYINYAKSHGIAVGPGRGSAAGSIVSYCLGITDIDPIKYQLLFERFLNPERVSMPDIDVDFCFERRQEIIDYVVEKYGKDRVCQIITFGTLAAKGVIRDVGRALDLPYAKCDAIAKMVPKDLGMTLELALKQSKDLRTAYESDEEVRYLIDMSMRLEGLPRHSSMHAAGVVISKKSIDEYVPLSRGSDGSVTTQFTMTTLEELGLLKMDFLGLRTLTVIQNTVNQVYKNYGIKIDLLNLGYDDAKVFESIGTGRTDGIFQIESAGMQSFMKELKPENLEDIIAGISLYRPGPMDFIPKYIKGKNERANISYDCPQLEPILKPTYGCIVYQEQVMQIVRELAGYTLGRSDLVRRAMSKKKTSVMEKERQNFVYGNEAEGVKGCIANGIPEATANKIFDEMTDFAKYAFNKSHAACYAFISYQTAYLKYYYPKEFMAALMSSVMENTSKVAEYIISCRQMGIGILPPDVNRGESGFSVDGDSIRFGLSAIKSVGESVANEIIRVRETQGEYRSLEDFIDRLSNKEVNKRTLESFIKSGAMDSMPGNRRQKLQIMFQLLDDKSFKSRNLVSGQMSLFDFAGEEEKESFAVRMPEVGEFDKADILAFEKELLGVYISGHPLEEYSASMNRIVNAKSTDFIPDEESDETRVYEGQRVVLGGIISSVNIKTTKNMQTMAFLTLEDMVGNIEVIVFPKSYEKYRALIREDARVYIEGRAALEDEAAGRLICERVISMENTGSPAEGSINYTSGRAPGNSDYYADKGNEAEGREVNVRELWIQYMNMEDYESDAASLFTALAMSEGRDSVFIYLKSEKKKKNLGRDWTVNVNDEVIESLRKRLGEDNVKTVSKVLKI